MYYLESCIVLLQYIHQSVKPQNVNYIYMYLQLLILFCIFYTQ